MESQQIQDIKNQIQKLEQEKKYLEQSLGAHFSADEESTLKKITFFDKKIFNLKQEIKKIRNNYPSDLNPFENESNNEINASISYQTLFNEATPLINDNINSINSEQIIEMQYGDSKCCSSCCVIL